MEVEKASEEGLAREGAGDGLTKAQGDKWGDNPSKGEYVVLSKPLP